MPDKSCSKCGAAWPVESFHWANAAHTLRHGICSPCRRLQFRAYAKTDRGKQVKRAGILRREYGITEETYALMLGIQGGMCAICRQPETKPHRTGAVLRLCVDHDHVTGEPKALLCSLCNVGLGAFRESPELLTAAVAYLIALGKVPKT